MAVKLTKTSYYNIALRTSDPETGKQRRTRFHSADAAAEAAGARLKAGHKLEYLGYVTEPK